ncbi:hypothetical protein MAR_017623 [Mya arenaria]|uniref:Uncharacterized protein n=1 Tax=Mya arenaria TaxID=6604 RepID=A0ABY7ECS6_MYAAR|nr:uncharacterized protein LOC128236596 [Mya arenaria]WAR07665.1 hypothetical protein MAR_017623 [Mya arenaria]
MSDKVKRGVAIRRPKLRPNIRRYRTRISRKRPHLSSRDVRIIARTVAEILHSRNSTSNNRDTNLSHSSLLNIKESHNELRSEFAELKTDQEDLERRLDENVDSFETNIENIEARIEHVDSRVDYLDADNGTTSECDCDFDVEKFEALTEKVESMETKWAELDSKTGQVVKMETKMENIGTLQVKNELRQSVDTLEANLRFSELEERVRIMEARLNNKDTPINDPVPFNEETDMTETNSNDTVATEQCDPLVMFIANLKHIPTNQPWPL